MSDVLNTLRERLLTQDNRGTGNPLFLVEQERLIWPMDSQFAPYDGYVWQDSEDHECTFYSDEDLLEHVTESYDPDDEYSDDPTGDIEDHGSLDRYDEVTLGGRTYDKFHYIRIWEFVCAHFTEAAALRYIEENAHNLKNPRTYVSSQHRCPEWNAARKHLMSEKTSDPRLSLKEIEPGKQYMLLASGCRVADETAQAIERFLAAPINCQESLAAQGTRIAIIEVEKDGKLDWE